MFQHCRRWRFGVLPSTNIYARPIEGLAVLYDLTEDNIVEITDTRADNPPPHDLPTGTFAAGDMKRRRCARLPAPAGVITYSWQPYRLAGWHFRSRFDARQGTVLNRWHQSAAGLRLVAYEIAMSEMFVPYHDNDPNWFYRAYFDMGEFGSGNMATQLQKADCPSHAEYLNVTLHFADGRRLKRQTVFAFSNMIRGILLGAMKSRF